MKVLLPVDGSECTNHTLRWALQSLDRAETELYLLTVIDIGRLCVGAEVPTLGAEHEVAEATQQSLNRLRLDLQAQGFRVCAADSVFGTPAETICGYAARHRIDQIIMSSHRRNRLGKLLLGSTCEAVLRQASQPVLLLTPAVPSPQATA